MKTQEMREWLIVVSGAPMIIADFADQRWYCSINQLQFILFIHKSFVYNISLIFNMHFCIKSSNIYLFCGLALPLKLSKPLNLLEKQNCS